MKIALRSGLDQRERTARRSLPPEVSASASDLGKPPEYEDQERETRAQAGNGDPEEVKDAEGMHQDRH
jgi:hypothetical protein